MNRVIKKFLDMSTSVQIHKKIILW